MLSFYGILLTTTLPTKENNCLDNFMIKIDNKKLSILIAVLRITTTDRLPTQLALTTLKRNLTVNKNYTYINFEMVLSYVLQENLHDLFFCEDSNLLADALIKKLTDSIKNSTTITKIPKSKCIIKSGITTGILRCIKHRNNLQKRLRKDPHNEILKITYT